MYRQIMINKLVSIKLVCFVLLSFFFSCVSSLAAQEKTQSSEIIDDTQRKFDYYFFQAINSKALGNYDEAIDYFLHCHNLDSTNANVLVELGTFYNVIQEKNKALEYFKKAVFYDKPNYYYNMMLAGLSKELGLKQEVVDIYSYLLELYPDKLELRFEMANAYADNGELEKAVDELNELEKNLGVSESLALNKYRLYSMMDNKEKAFEEIQQIIEKAPGDIRYIVLIGDLYMENNQINEALENYEKAKKIDPDFPALILSLVNYYEKTGDSDAAQEKLKKAISSSSIDVDVKIQLLARYLDVLQQNKLDLKQVNSLFEMLFEQHPNNRELNLLYGNVLYLQDDKNGAIKQFETYIKDIPDSPIGYEQIIRIALPDENLEKIKEITTEALKHLPQEPQFYYYLGAVYFQQGNHAAALKVFKEGLENAAINNPILESDFFGQVGDLNYFLGNKEEAFESYENALKLHPQNIHVLNNYSYYLSLDRIDLDKAEKMSSLTIKMEPMNPTYLDTYGWVLYEQGSYIMAKIYIEKAIEYSEEPSAEVFEHFGDVLFKTGDEVKALEQWRKARELGGNSKELKRKIRRGKL